jgi:hypothetical protein
MHELAAARKRVPIVRVERDDRFDGQRSRPELFDGRSQLILYRFCFEDGVDGWPDAGGAGCSSFADGIPQLGLLHACGIVSGRGPGDGRRGDAGASGPERPSGPRSRHRAPTRSRATAHRAVD